MPRRGCTNSAGCQIGAYMIIVSESPAKATQLVRVNRYTGTLPQLNDTQ
jgi:hypothetical protein